MNLRDYLYFERKTLRELAKELHIDARYLGRIKNKQFRPSLRLALDIERLTEGKVTAKELLEDKYEHLK